MHKPIKIIFDASPLLGNKTGVAYYIERLIVQLARQYPKEIQLIGFYYNFLGRKDTSLLPSAPNIRYRPIRLIPSKIVYQLRRLGIQIPLELLTKERADFALFGNFLGYPSLLNTASATVVHDLTYLDLPDYVAAKNRRDLTQFVPQQIRRSRFVITVSAFSKRKIASQYGVALDDIVVTPIPPAPTTPLAESQRRAIIGRLGLTKPYVLFVGTIEPRKNIIALIDAYQKLSPALRERFSLVIVGRIGWNCNQEKARLAKAAEQGLNIIHLGYVSDEERTALYQSAGLFTTASHYEGFGMPVLEAMSFGIPCAVSDIEVFHEVAGQSALYFNQNDPAAIAKVWQSILANPKKHETLVDAGLKQAAVLQWHTIAADLFKRIKQEVD